MAPYYNESDDILLNCCCGVATLPLDVSHIMLADGMHRTVS